ncbi:Os01g0146351 [Oryza sativa Japonica Group]|uniref:Os01g0146351 protein n=1 Tax=Oryza sativa subsp. japonica TaxID=39947 RepID=A0A0P0UXY6_ORYSJ|nr:Os01g0146351 [Oryza sativa Japonica Group]
MLALLPAEAVSLPAIGSGGGGDGIIAYDSGWAALVGLWEPHARQRTAAGDPTYRVRENNELIKHPRVSEFCAGVTDSESLAARVVNFANQVKLVLGCTNLTSIMLVIN